MHKDGFQEIIEFFLIFLFQIDLVVSRLIFKLLYFYEKLDKFADFDKRVNFWNV